MTNINLQQTILFVQSLAAAGLRHVCIAPGSRSTPLTLAFDAHPDVEISVHLDERSAGFFALGVALSTDRPVALVCSSGTAVANFFPAVIEAHMSQVPLLILTADRPPELRHSGANQTIDQIKLFGDHVLWAVDAPLPEADPPSVAMRNVSTLASRAYATANGLRKGPVHINFPFRKPLEPEERDWQLEMQEAEAPHSPFTIYHSPSTILPDEKQLNQLTDLISSHPRGLIICGPRCPAGDFPEAVAALSRQSGYPIMADPISGVRYGPWVANTAVFSTYETRFQQMPGWPEPEIILRFGAVPISKWLNSYIDRIQPAHRLHIRENGVWADDSHRTTQFWQASETAVCQALTAQLPSRTDRTWEQQVMETETAVRLRLKTALQEANFDGALAADLVELVPPDSLLFMGNSTPIRHLDQYGIATAKPLTAYANRGASGIDGNISTGLGMALGNGKRLIMLVGDITFYHDMNGLLGLRQLMQRGGDAEKAPIPVTIVVINNDGGQIFRRLPIAQLDPPFTDLFLTPHGLTFAAAAELYGLDYVAINGRSDFRTALTHALSQPGPQLIEIQTSGENDEKIRKQINQLINKP